MLDEVKSTIAALELTDKDRAAVKLAEDYAALIDQSTSTKDKYWCLRWIGPELLKVLESLGATPVAREKLKTGTPVNAGPNKLNALRAKRRT